MNIDALILLLCGAFVAIQVIRALAWLTTLPSGAFLDAMLTAEVDQEDDLHALSAARRNRYRELRR
jgi:hypothetical protein